MEDHHAAWFPDLIGEQNCVYGRNYESWMHNEGYEEEYLFADGEACCAKWYPARTDCPDTESAVNPEAEDEPWFADKYPMNNYYFPDYVKNTCSFGRNYPSWYGEDGYEKYYLFRKGETCCEHYFPGNTSCPDEDITVQTGYYWEKYQDNLNNLDDMPVKYNHTYYPDLHADTCVNGTDYPAYMGSSAEYQRLHLFRTLDGCCKHWFGEVKLDDCKNTVIQGKYEVEPCPTNRPDCNNTSPIVNATEELLSKWYPSINEGTCKNDGNMETYMLQEDYPDWYLFGSKESCCAAFWSDQSC